MKKVVLSGLLALTLALGMVALTDTVARADAPLVTITGTVVSRVDEVLVVKTDKGNLTFDLDKSTEMPADLPVGSWITVSYDSDDKLTDRMDARKIVMAPEPTVAAPVNPTTPTTPSTPVNPVTPDPVTPQTTTAYETDRDELPATASPLPLMGGAGLLALAGGLLLRMRARRK